MGSPRPPASPGPRSSRVALRGETSAANRDVHVFSKVLARRPRAGVDLRQPQAHGDPFPLPMPAL
eukprot:1788641-Heterocapsa_arctica.AAC.1